MKPKDPLVTGHPFQKLIPYLVEQINYHSLKNNANMIVKIFLYHNASKAKAMSPAIAGSLMTRKAASGMRFGGLSDHSAWRADAPGHSGSFEIVRDGDKNFNSPLVIRERSRYNIKTQGALAQLVARFNGIEEVRSSNLLCSTKFHQSRFPTWDIGFLVFISF